MYDRLQSLNSLNATCTVLCGNVVPLVLVQPVVFVFYCSLYKSLLTIHLNCLDLRVQISVMWSQPSVMSHFVVQC